MGTNPYGTRIHWRNGSRIVVVMTIALPELVCKTEQSSHSIGFQLNITILKRNRSFKFQDFVPCEQRAWESVRR